MFSGGTLEKVGIAALVYAGYYAVKALCAAYAFFVRPGKNLRDYGAWAVVTGATDGIGRAYAFELAKQGMNVLLVSRTESKLADVAKEVSAKYPKVQVDQLAIDYSKFDESARAKVAAKLTSLDVGVLINNVGVSYPFTKYFHELKDDEVAGLVELNVNSTVWMTRIVLGDGSSPGMIARRRGAIVNTSSGAGRMISPLLCEYSAAKGFIENFSRGLNAELEAFNIHVQCQAPLFVTTKLAKIKRASLTVPTPAAYSRVAAAHIGFEDTVSPYWAHALQLWTLRQLPDWVAAKVCLNMHLPIRKAGMKKEAQKGAEEKKVE